MTALFPPNSKRLFPNLPATICATFLPMRVEPVAEIKGIAGSSASHLPTSASPLMRQEIPSGRSFFAKTSAMIFWQAMAQKGVFSLGFQTHTLPQTQARAVFQLHTATGKLKAEIMPTIPKGWYCSYIRCAGRSECIVNPCNWRDSPTAKSHISIISCTSPSPSCSDFPISRDTNCPRASFFSRRASPNCLTNSPRLGAGICWNTLAASFAVSNVALYSSLVVVLTVPKYCPFTGEKESKGLPFPLQVVPVEHPFAAWASKSSVFHKSFISCVMIVGIYAFKVLIFWNTIQIGLGLLLFA